MIKWITYNIEKLKDEYLGVLFSGQRKWLSVLLSPLSSLYTEYDGWRRRRAYIINLTAQIKSLEGFLNDTYDNQLRRIFIVSIPEGVDGRYMALEQEKTPVLATPLIEEGTDIIDALWIGTTEDVAVVYNFIVTVPREFESQEAQIIANVKRLKLAGKQFKVQYQ